MVVKVTPSQTMKMPFEAARRRFPQESGQDGSEGCSIASDEDVV
jgi:hypothetical protein